MTWMRKMAGIETIDRTGRADRDVAALALAIVERASAV
jgi:hypothetical protein